MQMEMEVLGVDLNDRPLGWICFQALGVVLEELPFWANPRL